MEFGIGFDTIMNHIERLHITLPVMLLQGSCQ